MNVFTSQFFPTNPTGQEQLYPKLFEIQVPPCRQGLERQISIFLSQYEPEISNPPNE